MDVATPFVLVHNSARHCDFDAPPRVAAERAPRQGAGWHCARPSVHVLPLGCKDAACPLWADS